MVCFVLCSKQQQLVLREISPIGCDGWPLNSTWLMAPLAVKSARALTRASPTVVKSQPKNKRVLASSSKKATEVKLPIRVLTYPSQKEIPKVTQNKKRKSFHPLVKEQKSAQRMLVSRSEIDPDLAKKNKFTSLERRSISQAVESQYVTHYQGYLSFCREHGLEPPSASSTDANLADYMDVLYLEGQPMNQGEKILASIKYFNGALRGSKGL